MNSPLGADELEVAFAPDINPDLARTFLEEAPVLAEEFSSAVQTLVVGAAGPADMTQARRSVHSLKGSAGLTGVRGIATLTHHAEDVLDALAEGRVALSPRTVSVLSEAADCLDGMVESLAAGEPGPTSARDVVDALLECADEIIADDDDRTVELRALRPPEPEPTSEDTERVPPPAPPTVPEPEPAPTEPTREVPGERTLRVSTGIVDNLLRLAGELAISTVQSQGAHGQMAERARTLREQHQLVQQRLLDLQELIEVRGVPATARPRPATSPEDTDDPEFDPLELDQYNELHSQSHAFFEAVNDFSEIALDLRGELRRLEEILHGQERVSQELSESVLSARMVSVSTILPRLERGLREACRATGKRAALEALGGELNVDGSVLDAIVDPLLHMLRNAIDHGIEPSAERVAAGKQPEGHLVLSFVRDGENVAVTLADDGRGIDVSRVRAAAIRKGLIAPDEERTDREILQLTVTPGFSTREGAPTHLSGRGMGMDVVHQCVLELKGSMDIASNLGGGTAITLRLPLTLISMHVLLVRVGDKVVGVPSGGTEQVLFSDAGTVSSAGPGQVFTLHGREYALRQLGEHLGQGPAADEPLGGEVKPLVLLDTDAGPTAVAVDGAIDGRHLVVKSLGEFVPRVPGVVGASILGDGSIAPVIDLREMFRQQSVTGDRRADEPDTRAAGSETQAPSEVLVVDDSLTARRMLSTMIAEAGYRVRTAIDGLDAIEAIEEGMPDLVLTDLEMPRMNGLELAAHLRSDDGTSHLPLLMVTSRSTDKHRQQAKASGIDDFITKPYGQHEVLSKIASLTER